MCVICTRRRELSVPRSPRVAGSTSHRGSRFELFGRPREFARLDRRPQVPQLAAEAVDAICVV